MYKKIIETMIDNYFFSQGITVLDLETKENAKDKVVNFTAQVMEDSNFKVIEGFFGCSGKIFTI